MNLKDYKNKKPDKLEAIDQYILIKTKQLVNQAKEHYKKYNISNAKKITEDFFWHYFCDNYLEIVKKRIYNNKKGKESAQYALYTSLLAILKLLAPIMPFITEEIYQIHYKEQKQDSIHLTEFSDIDIKEDKKILEAGDFFILTLSKIRQEKSNSKKPMNSEIILTLPKSDQTLLKEMLEDLKDVSVAKEIKEGKFDVEF
jgi:valyl-tRNA synthetase